MSIRRQFHSSVDDFRRHAGLCGPRNDVLGLCVRPRGAGSAAWGFCASKLLVDHPAREDPPWQCHRHAGVRTGRVAQYWKSSAFGGYTTSRVASREEAVAAVEADCTDAKYWACDDEGEEEEERADVNRLEGQQKRIAACVHAGRKATRTGRDGMGTIRPPSVQSRWLC
jgi:hypothetical protein